MTAAGSVASAADREAGAGEGRWRVRDAVLSLDRPVVMGVLNVTPDSFSDGGRYLEPGAARERASALVEAGADLVDIGGESTRPGAEPVSAAEEWSRIGPVFEALAELGVPLSVDTTKAEVAGRALDAGASVINDVSGLRFEPRLAELAAEAGAGLVVMHMRGNPRTMQEDVEYGDLVGEIREFLAGALARAVDRGCAPGHVVVDPGIGFGKSAEGNLEILARAGEFSVGGRPVLVGPSRKSFIGATLGLSVEERVEATAAACVMALERGARIFRVHDVRAVRRALDLAAAVRGAGRRADGRGPREA